MKFTRIKQVVISSLLSLMIFGGGIVAFAADDSAKNWIGTWTSYTFSDLNGVSEVGTTYLSAPAAYYDLYVKTGKHSNVGHKAGTVGQNEKIEHICWGQPLLARYGVVVIEGIHSPWFNA